MSVRSAGLHHITAIAGDPQANLDFYADILGLRFVKRTVNFDDPGTYHFYYGDGPGRPGTLLTFFPWGTDAPRGRPGPGQAVGISLAVPSGSLGWWPGRLARRGVEFAPEPARFGEDTLSFRDPDGIALALVEEDGPGLPDGGSGGAVPETHAVRGIHGVSLLVGNVERTAGFIGDLLGFERVPGAGGTVRQAAPGTAAGRRVDLAAAAAGTPRGTMGRGAIHHVAFRATDDAAQTALGSRAASLGSDVTPVRDRCYFRSVYFREPGGVLFEVATDLPGFAIDESPDALGMALQLPPWLEPGRASLERALPPIRVPGGVPA